MLLVINGYQVAGTGPTSSWQVTDPSSLPKLDTKMYSLEKVPVLVKTALRLHVPR